MAFDLADLLKDVSKSDTSMEQIEYISLELIDPDPNNFYSLSGLDELADSIATVGLQQPLRVRTGEDGHVTCVSGHRRRAAIMLIRDGGSDQFAAGVPCIRERGQDSAALSELKLIFANSATRVLNSVEISKQAERVEALLYQLKEEGYDFPGRMRDHVAQACKVSKTKLARLKVIRDNLDHQFKEQYEEGKLSEQAAYAIARLPQDVRDTLALAVPKRIIDGYAAERVLSQYKDGVGDLRTCLKSGQPCTNCVGRLRRAATTNSWEHQCDSTECCIECNYRSSCAGVCVHGVKVNNQEKADNEKAKADEELKRQKQQEKYRNQSVEHAKRFLRAIEAAGLNKSAINLKWGYTYGKESLRTVGDVQKIADGKFKKGTYLYKPICDFRGYYASDLAVVSEWLGCTTDYLLGLTDELNPTPSEPAAPKWRTGSPDKTGWYAAKFDCEGMTIKKLAWYDKAIDRYYFNKNVSAIEATCIGWYPIPED